MEPPRMLHSVCVDFGLVKNNTRAFVFNNTRITINSYFPEVTKCSGLLCDRKRIREVLQGNIGCGCYSMKSRVSNIVVSQSFNVSDDSYKFLFKMDDFSSNQFCRLYLNSNGVFQPTIRINSFKKIITLSIFEDSIDNVVDIINDNGDLNVIGWYNRGEINDQSNKENVDGT